MSQKEAFIKTMGRTPELLAFLTALCLLACVLSRRAPACAGRWDWGSYQIRELGSVRKGFIFVSVASYRDPRCKDSVSSAFNNARWPERVVCGVCEQNAEPSESCLAGPAPQGEVRLISISDTKAEGPCLARYKASTLFANEELFIQIDAHTTFRKDWDAVAWDLYNSRPTPRCVLTHHPIDMKGMEGRKLTEEEDRELFEVAAPWLNRVEFSEDNFMMTSCEGNIERGSAWEQSRSVGAGFMLCAGRAIMDVPFDPELRYIFNGEEWLACARFWTSGWICLAPDRCVVGHDYTDVMRVWDDHPVRWNSGDEESRKGRVKGEERLRCLLEGDRSSSEWEDAHRTGRGHGSARSLKEYWKTIEVDYVNKWSVPLWENGHGWSA